MKLDVKLLIATLIAGALAAVLDVVLYTFLQEALPGILLIPLMVLVLAVIVTATIMVVCEINNATDDAFLFLTGKGMLILGVVVSLLVLTVLTAVFQWIYELEMEQSTSVTSYIFVLDESGSMESNDPDCERYSAVQELMESMAPDTRYAAYAFADSCIQIRAMEPVSAGVLLRPDNIDRTVGSLTYIREALDCVYQDIQSGALDCGSNPQVILLTDGFANDMETLLGNIITGGDIINRYAGAGIRISTVGLSGNVDNTLLTKIAEKTNGNYVRVDHAEQLAEGFSSVAVMESSRDLFSRRNHCPNNLLYGVMRVAFLLIIGVFFAFIRAMATGKDDNTGLILAVGAVAALAGAILTELGTAIGLPAFLTTAVYLILIAITPAMVEIIYSSHTSININSYTDQMIRRR